MSIFCYYDIWIEHFLLKFETFLCLNLYINKFTSKRKVPLNLPNTKVISQKIPRVFSSSSSKICSCYVNNVRRRRFPDFPDQSRHHQLITTNLCVEKLYVTITLSLSPSLKLCQNNFVGAVYIVKNRFWLELKKSTLHCFINFVFFVTPKKLN